MILQIPDVLSADQVAHARQLLSEAEWVDGRVTAGHQSAQVKNNLQLPAESAVAGALGEMILDGLDRNPLFLSAALPKQIFPPLFNLYQGGHGFGTHVDNAIRQVPGSRERIRTDLSCTLFFSNPEAYEGGELVIEDTYGVHEVKLPAGHMVLYPSTSLHHVKRVTNGARVSSFFWLQSLVRDDAKRVMLFDLDSAVQQISRDTPQNPVAVQLTGLYHNLLRQWADQ